MNNSTITKIDSVNHSTQINKDDLIIDTIISGVDKKWNIYQLSKMIGKSVAETCSILAQGSAIRPDFAARIKPANWPTNLKSGHIFIGSYHTPVMTNPRLEIINNKIRAHIKMRMIESDYDWQSAAKELLAEKRKLLKTTGGSIVSGERRGWIKPGSHVFAKPILGKNFSEIFLPESTRQRLFRFGHLVDGQFVQSVNEDGSKKKSAQKWFSKEDILNDKLSEYAIDNGFTRVEPSNSMRTVYVAGSRSMGSVHNREIVTVNSDVT